VEAAFEIFYFLFVVEFIVAISVPARVAVCRGAAEGGQSASTAVARAHVGAATQLDVAVRRKECELRGGTAAVTAVARG